MVNLPHFAVDKKTVSPRVSFASLVDKVHQVEYKKTKEYKERMSQMFGASRYMKAGARAEAHPIIPLVEPKKEPDEDKSKYIVMELKVKAGRTTSATTYKKYIPKFEEGTVQEWITFLEDYEEVITQNSVDVPTDKVAIIKTILVGESRACFDSSLEEQAGNDVTDAKIKVALDALGKTIFPHRALEHQKR